MRLRSKLIGMVLVGATALAPACAPRGTVVVATREETPPAPRAEYAPYRPGYVWIQGRWVRSYYGQWRWQPGFYQRERVGYVYVPGHWLRRGNTYTWVEARWMRRGSVVTRGQLY